jgi:hypothetical protein
LALTEIAEWPTHKRFREAHAGKVATDEQMLRDDLNIYLENPKLDSEARHKFVADEVTFLDGRSGRRTGEWLSGLA